MRRFISPTAIIAAVLLVSLVGAKPMHAESPQDADALSGLNEVKVAFDMQTGNSAALLKQLEVIEETRESLIKQGVKPSFRCPVRCWKRRVGVARLEPVGSG